MNCPYLPELPYSDFRERLREKMGRQRFPMSGSLELNFRCNLRCQHCYVAHGHTGIPGMVELSFLEIQRILDEIVDVGCLWLLLTGGEVLMRRDFADIYLYGKRKGLLLTVFTNATMLTPGMADMFAEWRPFNLEITLYGHTQETYERVTKIPGSHRRCYKAIELLLERDVPFRLKTVLMAPNFHEFGQMKAFAEGLGVNFHYDALINAGIDGCGKPLNMRLPAQTVVEIEQQDEQVVRDWQEFYTRYHGWQDNGLIYQCSAGLSSFHIDPYGKLAMCMMAREATYDLRSGSFKDGWEQFLLGERSRKSADNYACSGCSLAPVCASCPGWSFTEHGDSQAHVDYICEVTHRRAQAFGLNDGLIQIQIPLQVETYKELIS